MARVLASSAVFLCVAVFSALVIAWGVQFTLAHVGDAARRATVNGMLRASYVSTLEMTRAEALDIAKTVAVIPGTPPGPAGKTAQATDGFTHTVSVESLRVRSGPKKTTDQVFALKGGTKVTAIRSQNGWVLIDAGNGWRGWVFNRFLRPVAGAPQRLSDL